MRFVGKFPSRVSSKGGLVLWSRGNLGSHTFVSGNRLFDFKGGERKEDHMLFERRGHEGKFGMTDQRSF